MAFKKGVVTNPNGRRKGSENKATSKVREAIAIFAENNVDKLQEWLDRIGEDDPKGAATLYKDIIEYHIPKLARTEGTLDVTGTVVNWPLPQTGLDE